MLALGSRVRANLKCVDVVSAESASSLALFLEFSGFSGRRTVLGNGVLPTKTELLDPSEAWLGSFAVSVGTAAYKRIDRLISLFEAIREEYRLERLVVIGKAGILHRTFRQKKDVEFVGELDQAKVLSALRHANIYLSSSEIENSSNAVLEALTLTKRAILSAIPSHIEMVNPESTKLRIVQGQEYLEILVADKKAEAALSWGGVVTDMLTAMGLIEPSLDTQVRLGRKRGENV